jgi:lipopolysaccharide/colanic/teichoic acid biosynthesis glycosyltransferase
MREFVFLSPRSEVKEYVDLYTAEQRVVLLIRPGITDWASINYRD